MITSRKTENAFNATEDLLLVPLPIGRETELEGFAGQVFERFKVATTIIRYRRGLGAGEAVVVGGLAHEQDWVEPYALALCGLHRRAAQGWVDTPQYLKMVLDSLAVATAKGDQVTVATAGIPGTGFSGVRGNASPSAIETVLETHRLAVTVYQDTAAGDRAMALTAEPTPLDSGY